MLVAVTVLRLYIKFRKSPSNMIPTPILAIEDSATASPRPVPRAALVWGLCAAGALFFYFLGQDNIVDLDLFHQMALFRVALQRGWIPFEDVFAYTSHPGPPVHYE